MSSSCLSGGGRAYRLESLDLEIIKSPSTSWISSSSSPSSTLSESSNCPLGISTRKSRTPRKRPNQTYNEAAAILSTAYPKVFPTKHLRKPPNCKFTKSCDSNNSPLLFEHNSDLLMPFQVVDDAGLILLDPPLLQRPPNFPVEPKGCNPCSSPGEINSHSEVCDKEDFDAESILDEEIGELGIDSIMGNLGMENESFEDPNTHNSTQMNSTTTFAYGYPVGLGFDFGYGMRRELRAMRNGDECDWWRFPSVNMFDVTPKIAKMPAEKKQRSNKGMEFKNSMSDPKSTKQNPPGQESVPQPNAGLLLKLNYDAILNAWSDKGSPFSGQFPGSDSAGNDVQAKLAQIDLFSENGGIREASVLRYKEKRRTRLFSKKIRYQVRKVNADRRPRMKGRFVRTPNSSDD